MPTTRFHSAWYEYQHNGGGIDMDGAGVATFKLAIVTNAATINADTTNLWSSISTHQVSTGGTAYTGPITLTSPTAGLDGSSNWVFDCADPAQIAQDASGFSNGRSLIVYEDATGRILWSHTEDTDFGNVSTIIDISFGAGGILGTNI